MNIKVKVKGETTVFTEASDGWFENKEKMLAINPEKTACVTDPWHADHICDAPKHEFEIVG